MNGDKLFLDTNAFIYFFEGRSNITELVVQTPAIYFSPISEIELLSGGRTLDYYIQVGRNKYTPTY